MRSQLLNLVADALADAWADPSLHSITRVSPSSVTQIGQAQACMCQGRCPGAASGKAASSTSSTTDRQRVNRVDTEVLQAQEPVAGCHRIALRCSQHGTPRLHL